ncbi:MAG: DUF4279 domain-containing protein [Thermomicrobiales bacterium]
MDRGDDLYCKSGFSVTFVVSSTRYGTEEMISAIGITPDETRLKCDQPEPDRSLRENDQSSGLSYRSNLAPETRLVRQVEHIILRLEPVIDKIDHLAHQSRDDSDSDNKPEIETLLNIDVSSRQDNDTDYLRILPHQFALLARMGAKVKISFAWDGFHYERPRQD